MQAITTKRLLAWMFAALVAIAALPSVAFAATTVGTAANDNAYFTVYAYVPTSADADAETIYAGMKPVKTYTEAEMAKLASANTTKLGYLVNAKGAKVYATNSYVKIGDLLEDSGLTLADKDAVSFIDGTKIYNKNGFSKLTAEQVNSELKFFPAYSASEPANVSSAVNAPAVIALKMGDAAVETTAQVALDSITSYNTNDTPRLLWGMTEDSYKKALNGGNTTPSNIGGLVLCTNSIENAAVTGVEDTTYTGKAITPVPTVKGPDGTELKSGTDYTLSYGDNKKVGKGTVTLTGKGAYEGSTKIVEFNITKATNSIVTKANKTFKKKKVAKKAQKFALPKASFGTTKYTVSKKDKKGVLSLKSGKVKVKKGAKKGTYTMKVKAKVKKTDNYSAVSKTITVKVKVK